MERPERAEVSVVMMTQVEAKAVVNAIKTSLDRVGSQALELKQREGWKALGYESWAECSKAEFGKSAQRLYTLIATEEVRAAFTFSHAGNEVIANISDRALEPLIPHRDVPEVINEAIARATELSGGRPTARDVQAAVDTVLERHGLGVPTTKNEGPQQSVSPYRLMQKCIDDVLCLLATVNAPDTPEQRGLGGIAVVSTKLTDRERREISNYLATLIESLQEWAEALGE